MSLRRPRHREHQGQCENGGAEFVAKHPILRGSEQICDSLHALPSFSLLVLQQVHEDPAQLRRVGGVLFAKRVAMCDASCFLRNSAASSFCVRA